MGILLIKIERELLEIILSSKHIRYRYVEAALLRVASMHILICVAMSLLGADYQCIDFRPSIIGNGYNILFPSRRVSVIDVLTPAASFLFSPPFCSLTDFQEIA